MLGVSRHPRVDQSIHVVNQAPCLEVGASRLSQRLPAHVSDLLFPLLRCQSPHATARDATTALPGSPVLLLAFSGAGIAQNTGDPRGLIQILGLQRCRW